MPAQVKWYGDEFLRRVRQGVRDGMENIGEAIVKDMKRSMQSTPGGGMRIERRRKTRRRRSKYIKRRTPSLPGHPPAVQTGTLIRETRWRRVSDAMIRVGAWAKYALYLELGTRTMFARPFIRPAVDRKRGDLPRLLAAAIRRRIR